MNTVTTVILSILIFGFLIFIHEFGHYIFARIFKVTVNEFSIGMGPRLLWYDSKKTGIRYSLAMFPIGGYVAMAGEDSESDDPNAFDKKPAYKRFIITAAGAAVNITAGFLAMIILTLMVPIGGTTVADFVPTETTGYEISSEASGLNVGDKIIAVDGNRVRIADELSYEIMRLAVEPVDLTVIRDGEEMTLYDVVFPGVSDSGQSFGTMDFKVYREDKSFSSVMGYSIRKSALVVRMCWESIFDLLTGRYTFAAVSGPVGISSAIGDAARAGGLQLLNIVTLISINLGVMNLLPIPALDGGRLITLIFEMISGKRVPKKVEGMINAIGLAALLLLSVVVMIKDVISLII